VPLTLVHDGKYKAEDKLKIQTIHKLKTTKKSKQCKVQQNRTTWFSRLLRHLAKKQGGGTQSQVNVSSGADTRWKHWKCRTDWLIENGFTSAPIQYRLYVRRFLQVLWPNQQCQSTEGGRLVIQTSLSLTMLTSPCYN